MARVALSTMSNTAWKVVHDAEGRNFAASAGTENNVLQQNAAKLHGSPQGFAKKTKGYDGSRVHTLMKSNAKHRRKSKSPIATKNSTFNRPSMTGWREPCTNPMWKERAKKLERLTTAIENEIAGDTAHEVSKKKVAEVLEKASMNAPKLPPVLPHVRTGTKNPDRSPSVATRGFIAEIERGRAQKHAPTLVRRDVNWDYGPYYPGGLCRTAKEWEAANFHNKTPPSAFRFSLSDNTPY